MLYRDYGGFITLSIFDVGTEFAARNSHPDLGIPEYYQITVVGLIALLGMKEMLLVSREEDRFSLDSVDMGIYPLIICFIASFLFASLEIIFTR